MVFVMIAKDESWAEKLNQLKDCYVKNIVPIGLFLEEFKLKSLVFYEDKFIIFLVIMFIDLGYERFVNLYIHGFTTQKIPVIFCSYVLV